MMRRMKGAGLALCMIVGAGARAAWAQSDGHPDRPVPGPAPALHFPRAVTRQLPNGVRVVVLEDHALPIVSVSTVLHLPDAFDPPGKEGVGRMTGAMLGEGTISRTADQIAEAKADLGSGVSAYGFMTVTANVDRSLVLMADQLLQPAFAQASLDRVKANAIVSVQRAFASSGYLAQRVFANTVYGATHPYARAATEASLSSITRDDLVAYHTAYYRPRNTTFVVAGDITADSAVAKLRRAFAGWQGGGEAGQRSVAAPAGPGATQIYLYDRPGSPQSTILVGGLGPRRDTPDHYALDLMNAILGGSLNSRLSLDLRGTHAWTYGAGSAFDFRVVPEIGTFTAGADVAAAKTDSAVVALMGDLTALRTTRPVTDSELVFAQRAATLSLPLSLATVQKIAEATAGLIAAHLPLDYYDHLVERLSGVTTAEAQRAATRDLDPGHLAIVVVGDRATIERGLRATNLAPVVIVDPLAKPAASTP
jgi:zinc protease